MKEANGTLKILPRDGVRQRFYIVKDDLKLGITLDRGQFSSDHEIITDYDLNVIDLIIDTAAFRGNVEMMVSAAGAEYIIQDQDETQLGIIKDESKTISINAADDKIKIEISKIN
nr:hypothetical protein [Clostridia bacterium]PZN11146.1 MAG: hypothetical protein DIU64_03750 [Caldicoprobacter oshimai]